MDLKQIAAFIKMKRKALGMTQAQLAERLAVSEKAVSRWETGRGTPDISLLLPLAHELHVEVGELLNATMYEDANQAVAQLLAYHEATKHHRYSRSYFRMIGCYGLSALIFLCYLRFEYDPHVELNYLVRLAAVLAAALAVVLANRIYEVHYAEKLKDKHRIQRFSQWIVFVYYAILLFNMVLFARYQFVHTFNLIPFATIAALFRQGSAWGISVNIAGNLLVFMPLSYFLYELFAIREWKMHLLISCMIVLLIELAQYLSHVGVADVDDVWLCTCGMMLFYSGYRHWTWR